MTRLDPGFPKHITMESGVKDGSDISELMTVFSEDDAYNDKFPVTSSAKRRLKLTEEGRRQMTATLQRIIDEEADKRQDAVNNLNIILINNNRLDDLRRSATDRVFQQQLMDELLGSNSETDADTDTVS